MTHQFVITQSGSGTVSAYTKSGDPAWISADLGFADNTPVRFAVSADQAYLLVYNA